MQISTKGRYALRLMLDLAVHNTGELVKIKDISARENISEKYLEQIISSLKKAGYVKSLQLPLCFLRERAVRIRFRESVRDLFRRH